MPSSSPRSTARSPRSPLDAIDAGKHVLIEKPAAISVAEIDRLIASPCRQSASLVRVGYNHRYHPALQKARELVDAGAVGPLMFIRARYGHGGRVGYDREWRADPKLSGGGELIDQGVHLIDLAGWFLGDFPTVEGHAATYYWDMPVDDNAFMTLRNADGADRLAASVLLGMEEPVFLRDLRAHRQAAIDGLGRQLRRRAADLLPDVARDGSARDDDLGIPARRRFVARWRWTIFWKTSAWAAHPTPGSEGSPRRAWRSWRKFTAPAATALPRSPAVMPPTDSSLS